MRIVDVFIWILLLVMMHGCTLNMPTQSVYLTGGSKNAVYYINSVPMSDRDGYNGVSYYIFKKYPLVITGSKEGYLTKSKVCVPKKLDPVVIGSALLFPLLPLEFLYPGGPFKHPKSYPAMELEAIKPAAVKNVYFASSSTLSNIILPPMTTRRFKKYSRYRRSSTTKFKSKRKLKETYDVAYSVEGKVDEMLKGMDCKIDHGKFITDYDEFVNLSLRVLNCEHTFIKRGKMSMLTMTQRWIISDRFGTKLDSMDVIAKSQIFSQLSYPYGIRNSYYEHVQTAVEDGLTKIMNDAVFVEKVQTIKAKMNAKLNSNEIITLNSDTEQLSLEDVIDAQLTIDLGDFHGSGLIISNDGYLLTSNILIAKRDSINAILSDGVILKANVIRTDPLTNIALLKIDTTGLKAFKPSRQSKLNLGDKVYAIGTPADILLSQTISHGIVSGFREENDIVFIQTDARLSTGDNGCPLVNGQGQIVGIVNEKIIDRGVEGLSFAVPIDIVLERLRIKYN
jgi:S1-C subfamily serine protease